MTDGTHEVLDPLRVLIVEDDAVIAMELEMLLGDAGHAVVGWASCSVDAKALAADTLPDLALVDLHLIDGCSGMEVARHILGSSDTKVVFVTANAAMLPDDLIGATAVLAKPYTAHGVAACLSYLLEGLRRPPPKRTKPLSLRLAPAYRRAWAS